MVETEYKGSASTVWNLVPIAARSVAFIVFIPLSSVVCLANRRFRTMTEGMTSEVVEVAKLICFVISSNGARRVLIFSSKVQSLAVSVAGSWWSAA
jgi:hypothetical protein